jgi:hypothetical protein
MALHNVSPVREQIRAEMLAALANGALMTATELYAHCPSATESTEIARIAHDMRRTGKLETGEQVIHPLGMKVNTYRLPTTEDPRIEAAKVTNAAPKIMPTRQPAIKRKPAPGHPFAAPIRPQAAHDSLPRVTRDLPINLQSPAPIAVLEEATMPEAPADYDIDPDAFTLEPRDPEAEADIDSDLVSALLELAHQEIEADSADDLLAKMVPLPQADDDDDVLAMASADVSEIAAAMGKEEPKKVCQCVRINSLPPLPEGYIYGGIKVWIEARHDVGHLAITTHDEGGGPFCSLKATGHLSFDTGDMVAIGRVADALIKLHQEMIHE